MKAYVTLCLMLASVFLAGCTIDVADPIDVSALARYQNLKPGTPVVIVLRVGMTINGVDVDSPNSTLEQEGTLAWITKDTVSLTLECDGHSVRKNYAGRMIREIRVKKNTPNQALLPTPTAVTPAASHPSRQP